MASFNLTNDNIKTFVYNYINENHIHNLPNINEWDVSNVTDMSSLFHDYADFNEDISNWDVSNVTNMEGMFAIATSFNQSLRKWNVSNVTNMASMFVEAMSFNQPLDYDENASDDVGKGWDVSNVTNMDFMFAYATSFNQPLNNWNVSNVTSMNQMFYGAESFDQPLNNWNVSNVTNMTEMFASARSFNQDLSSWQIRQNINTLNMFDDNYFMTDTSKWPTVIISEEQIAQRAAFIEQQRQLRENPVAPPPVDNTKFPDCVICQEPLNNIVGPSSDGSKDNNVIHICKNNHLNHRLCAIRWKNPPNVNVAGQMGNTEWVSMSGQARANTCPICASPMFDDLESRPAVEDSVILADTYKGGRRRTKKLRARKLRKSKMTRHLKKSKITRKNRSNKRRLSKKKKYL